jgi:TetR/AcrR family transcriptional repressor of nem operon
MKTDTKDRIIQIGAEIIHRNGYYHTGIQEILNAAQVPKGSFYNYFKSKEDFGFHIIDHFSNQFTQLTKDVLEDSSVSPLERIRKVLEGFKDFFKSNGFCNGCPIGNLSQEMGDSNPTYREKLKAAIDIMVDGYAHVLTEAQKAGEISEKLDVKETAYFIIASWHGALIQMKVSKNIEPLHNHTRFIFEHVLKT